MCFCTCCQRRGPTPVATAPVSETAGQDRNAELVSMPRVSLSPAGSAGSGRDMGRETQKTLSERKGLILPPWPLWES